MLIILLRLYGRYNLSNLDSQGLSWIETVLHLTSGAPAPIYALVAKTRYSIPPGERTCL